MSSYQGHIAGGIVTYIVMSKLPLVPPDSPVTTHALLFSMTLLGSLFPDVDIKSMGQKVFYHLLALFVIFCLIQKKWVALIMMSLLGLIPLVSKHRGITHNPYFLIIAPFVLHPIISHVIPVAQDFPRHYHLFFIAGAFSHLILDYGFVRFFKKLKLR
jgi:membrane-bound metal-dependent hydrolase YbcI (DUF457 family)